MLPSSLSRPAGFQPLMELVQFVPLVGCEEGSNLNLGVRSDSRQLPQQLPLGRGECVNLGCTGAGDHHILQVLMGLCEVDQQGFGSRASGFQDWRRLFFLKFEMIRILK